MSKTILLVEDNQSDIALTKRAFASKRILNEIVVAEDGQEALDYLFGEGAHAGQEPPPLPAVILLDLKLPRVDGLEVLLQVRANPRTKRIPVVMLTSSKEQEDLVASYERGVNSYIRKPVDFNAFVEAVAQLGMYWLVLNEPPPK